LVLLSPALGNRSEPGAPLPPAVAQRIVDLETLGAAQFAAARAARLVHAPATKPAIVARVAAAMATVTQPGYGQAVHALACGDLLSDAAHVTAPTLVLTGSGDLVTPPAASKSVYEVLRASRRCPQAEFAELQDAGHAAYFEAPDAIIAHITAFLGAPSA
jgi:pimeloyl-ACP methyl ester carboxylesterase